MSDPPNKLFLKTKTQLIKKLGDKALNNTQLDSIGKQLFGKRYIGTHPQDRTVFKNGFQIINTDTYGKAGVHWVALYITPKTIYVYDSFGRPTKKLLKVLSKNATRKIVDSEYDPEQFGNSQICGHLCLSWLHVVKTMGIKQALKI